VQLVEPTGSETQVFVRIGETAMSCAFRERVSAGPGDTIGISPDLELVHLFAAGTGQRLAA
jgi:multiple sugar transport system ATP-binding protein